MNLIAELEEHQASIAALRRDIHAHPELGYEEHRTAALVADTLQAWGVEVHRGLGGTGVVGVIRGRQDNGRAIGLRADMDALPLQEANTFGHASRNPGKMHACGHDGHTAMLLAAARYLTDTRDFSGTVYTVFQPAEEGLIGAGRMISDGLFERFPMQAIFGMHNWPGMPVGQFGVIAGPVMASSSYFCITIQGEGGHAAKPHLTRDPIMAAVQVAQALQTTITRNRDPLDPAVLSITQIHAGSANNVIPDSAELRGTLRTFTEATLTLVHRRLEDIARGICQGLDCELQFQFKTNYPPTFNHPAETRTERRRTDRPGRHRSGQPQPETVAERRGLCAHAQAAPRQLHLDRQRRWRAPRSGPRTGTLCAAQPQLRLQRRTHPHRRQLLGPAGAALACR